MQNTDKLQLALCLWTSPGDWPVEVTEMRNELCSDTSRNFSNIRLQDESMSAIKVFRDLNLVGEERPSKRQKTLPDTDLDISRASYKELVILVNGSSQDSAVLELTGLHDSIV